MKRDNPYEAAFEAYLRDRRWGYLATDETRRTHFDDEPIKSLDFVVSTPNGSQLLIDIKGRKYPTGKGARKNFTWQNWVDRGDIESLERWQVKFGPSSIALLVFAYRLADDIRIAPDTPDLWIWRSKRYLFRAVRSSDYREHMRTRSLRWNTVHLNSLSFRLIVHPFSDFVHGIPQNQEVEFFTE